MISWSWAFFTRVKKLILRERSAYAISSFLFVPLENYHLVTILGAAPSITYPRGQACARHSLRVHLSRYIPHFQGCSFHPLVKFLFFCSRVSSQVVAGSHDFTRSSAELFQWSQKLVQRRELWTRRKEKNSFLIWIIKFQFVLYSVYLFLSCTVKKKKKEENNKYFITKKRENFKDCLPL